MFQKRFHRLVLAAVVLGSLALTAACSTQQAATPPSSGAQTPKKPLKIGWIGSLSGVAQSFSLNAEVSRALALKEFNAAGGINGHPVEIIEVDSASNPQEVVTLVRKLANDDKVLQIVGPTLSAECEVAFPVANQLSVPITSPICTKPGIPAANRPWSFRNVATDLQLFEPAVRAYISKYKTKTFAVIYDTKDAWSKNAAANLFPPIVEKLGLKIIADPVTFTTGTLDFSAQVTKLRQINADGIIYAGFPEEASKLGLEMQRQGYVKPLVSGGGINMPKVIELVGKVADGWMYPQTFWAGNPDPKVQEYVKKYREEGKEKLKGRPDPEFVAAHTYTLMHMIKQVYEQAGITADMDLKQAREKIRDGFAGLKNFQGIEGATSMTASGDVEKNIVVLMVENGALTAIK